MKKSIWISMTLVVFALGCDCRKIDFKGMTRQQVAEILENGPKRKDGSFRVCHALRDSPPNTLVHHFYKDKDSLLKSAEAMDLAEKEFSQLLAAPGDWRKLLPPDCSRSGSPDLVLRNGYQPGIYEAIVWCNPGEKGTIYLKAFEITKGTPLSAKLLEINSNCIPGWSGDPREQFFSAMHFTIYEGEWGQFYGARFELWFKPDAGGPERKLFEKNYKIQGWQI